MASRTQLRLAQLSGSLDASGGALASQALISDQSLQGVLDSLAASVKRIHGGSDYLSQTAGAFSQTIDVTGAITGSQGLKVGGDVDFGSTINVTNAAQFLSSVHLSSDAAVLNFGADDDVTLTHVHNTGLLLNGASQIQLRDSAIFLNSSADGTLDIEADTQINLGTDTSGVAITIGHTTSEVTIADNLTVTGDLIVNGSTTTVSTANLLVEDKLVTLNDGGTAASGGGAGIEIEENSSITGYFKVASDRNGWELKAPNNAGVATFDIDATKTITIAGALNIEGDSAINQDVTSDASVTFGDVTANGGVVIDNITIDGTEIDLSAGDLTLDVAGSLILDADSGEIFFKDAGTSFGEIKNITSPFNMLALSSSAGYAAGILSNSGVVYLGNNDASNSMSINANTPNEIQFFDASDRMRINLDSSTGDGVTLLSGSVKLDNGAAAGQLIFKEGGAANTVTLDVPSSITSYTLTLPAANGSSGQVLKLADGSGNLTFGDATGDLARSAYKVTAQITPSDLDFSSSGNVSLLSSAGYSALNITKANSDLPSALEVFVNGQLLVSGSDGGADTDYTHKGATSLKFAFNLEADDIVQIIQR